MSEIINRIHTWAFVDQILNVFFTYSHPLTIPVSPASTQDGQELRPWVGAGLTSLQPWGTEGRGVPAQSPGKGSWKLARKVRGEQGWDLEPWGSHRAGTSPAGLESRAWQQDPQAGKESCQSTSSAHILKPMAHYFSEG